MARSVRSRIGTRSEHNRLLISDGRRSLWTRSIQTLDQMQASHIQPDAFTCSSAISSCEKGAWQIALRCFSSLCKSVLPNAVVQLASGCCMRGESFRPTGSTPWAVWLSEVELRYTTLMMAFSRYGEWRQALDLFRCLVAENVQMDLVLHGAAVKACEEGSQWQEALCILQRLARTALVPDTTLLNSAISACEKAEEWPWALHLLRTLSDSVATWTWPAVLDSVPTSIVGVSAGFVASGPACRCHFLQCRDQCLRESRAVAAGTARS